MSGKTGIKRENLEAEREAKIGGGWRRRISRRGTRKGERERRRSPFREGRGREGGERGGERIRNSRDAC